MVYRSSRRVLVALIVLAVLAAGGSVRAQDAGPSPSIVMTPDQRYGQAVRHDGVVIDLMLDLYELEGDTRVDRPVIVWLHAGGFHSGDKASPGDVEVARVLAGNGYVVASVNYRIRPIASLDELLQAGRDAQFDAQGAVQWLRANESQLRLDEHRITAMGWSAGGITAVHVAYQTFGDGRPDPNGPPATVAAAVSIGGFAVYPEQLSARPDVPVLFLNGMRDDLVRFELPTESCRTLVAAGHACELVAYPSGHDLLGYEQPALRSILDFLARRGVAAAG